MKADRETNRLPLRAGAMLLLAVAVVFIGLGWHRAATSGDDGDSASTAAVQSTTESGPAESSAKGDDSASTPASSSKVADAADVGSVCVLNAGTVTGLAGKVSDSLEQSGFDVSGAENLSTGSISENTVFYDEGEEAAAQKVADVVPGGASVDPRPAVFTRCEGELAVIVVTE
ncbi:LytR C-terminal domain-containing protein [Gordonia sp. HY002]|uniref:LytR C-terminal domain-containing protein n=1 Tax=Gordonia zhenghanii TaxID=2911516 RepID=UPI001EF03688|nr:LytR C-terminal domain-containing protein [Gordonia zhenghanii]MCF8569098.1 LytR C-terminal domain-containing protein [Gordonia zhenghanii]MCF8603417.1 LytR C-terminal domain-containing protein [Gordonia zhenghanii]